MEWIKNLKISQKLQLLIILSTSILIIVCLVSFKFIVNGQKSINEMYTNRLMPIEWLILARNNTNAAKANTYDLVTETNINKKDQLIADIDRRTKENNEFYEKYEKRGLDNYESTTLAKLKDSLSEYRPIRTKTIALSESGQNAQALVFFKSADSKFQKIIESIKELSEYNTKEADKLNELNKQNAAAANIILLTVCISSLILLITLGIMISNMITRPIQYAINELTTGSSEVSAASAQVEAASLQLAEGSTEQAASIQETSSALEEATSMVQQNNENTKQAATLAKNAKTYAQKSNSEMTTMMQSMEDLKQSSNEIAKIIKVIDEIAFQTNLLSLNAAVEAARAGDAGKGFAVVAEEVRNLAQRSAQAAKDTASIIENNISLSENSAVIAKTVNDALGQIDIEARKVSELLEEIAIASDEQSKGINEINKAIQQMDNIIHENAATAEESASASSELASQAANVNEIVYSLIKLVEGRSSASTGGRLLSSSTGSYPKRSLTTQKNNFVSSSSRINAESVIPLGDDF